MPTDSACESVVGLATSGSDDIASLGESGEEGTYLNDADVPYTVQTQDASLAKLLIILETVLTEIELRQKLEREPAQASDNA